MAEDIEKRLRVIQGLASKLEANHLQVDEMMLVMKADGLGAMQYGQFGNGNIPDPTSAAAFTAKRTLAEDGIHTREVIVWRDHRPEEDRKAYYAAIAEMEKQAVIADTLRQRYMSANMDIRNRLDPTDWCRLHYDLHLYEGHRRVKGDMCSTCAKFAEANGRGPTATEADYFHRHGRWQHKLYDPKERKAV